MYAKVRPSVEFAARAAADRARLLAAARPGTRPVTATGRAAGDPVPNRAERRRAARRKAQP